MDAKIKCAIIFTLFYNIIKFYYNAVSSLLTDLTRTLRIRHFLSKLYIIKKESTSLYCSCCPGNLSFLFSPVSSYDVDKIYGQIFIYKHDRVFKGFCSVKIKASS
jgi:hypothetical protein